VGIAVRRTAALPLAYDPRIDLKRNCFKKMDYRVELGNDESI
jgi:hypothetical protein